MADIVVIGSLNMDLVVSAERAPEAGETLPAEGFQTIPGGKGANQAAAAGKLGASVEMAGRVGKDAFGQQMRANLESLGVGTSLVLTDPETASGTALIVVDRRGENRILIVAGANGRVSSADLDAAAGVISAAKLVILQFEIPMPVVEYAASLACRSGAGVILNPAPAYPIPPGLLKDIKYLILNESEAGALTGAPVEDLHSAGRAASRLIGQGAGAVILTLGARGALLALPGHTRHFPARKVDPVDTTAAGDAFVGAFACRLAQGASLDDAVRYAVAAGTLTVTRFGAQTSLPSRPELEKFLAEG